MTDELNKPEPVEEYDHSAPKPKHAALAVLMSLLIPGGGQFIKGHFTRVAAIWGILIVAVFGVPSAADLFALTGSTRSTAILVARIGFCLVWLYQVWDAGTRP